jgi:hypothetical protein
VLPQVVEPDSRSLSLAAERRVPSGRDIGQASLIIACVFHGPEPRIGFRRPAAKGTQSFHDLPAAARRGLRRSPFFERGRAAPRRVSKVNCIPALRQKLATARAAGSMAIRTKMH